MFTGTYFFGPTPKYTEKRVGFLSVRCQMSMMMPLLRMRALSLGYGGWRLWEGGGEGGRRRVVLMLLIWTSFLCGGLVDGEAYIVHKSGSNPDGYDSRWAFVIT